MQVEVIVFQLNEVITPRTDECCYVCKSKKPGFIHRHFIFERGSSRDCTAKVVKNNFIRK